MSQGASFLPVGRRRHYLEQAMALYGNDRADRLAVVPVPFCPAGEDADICRISLPDWAWDLGVNGTLVVPVGCCGQARSGDWKDVDWYSAVEWFLHGSAERKLERELGPILSYSSRLRGWDGAIWGHAWVNRIALFLRRWAARELGGEESALFGSLQPGRVELTHDVDAIRKTLALRGKQAVFHFYNALRSLARGRVRRSSKHCAQGLQFLLGGGAGYFNLADIVELESRYGETSLFNIFARADDIPSGLVAWLMDPAYRLDDEGLAEALRSLRSQGWRVGLHPSFKTYRAAVPIESQKHCLEKVLGEPVTAIRQHWLRFSWSETWAAQAAVGFADDFTLGFNDRPGFRTGAAFPYHPWDDLRNGPLGILVHPTVLMDSHLFDYADMTDADASDHARIWVDEVLAVGGVAAVIWHQRVFGPDYGWGECYVALLDHLKASRR